MTHFTFAAWWLLICALLFAATSKDSDAADGSRKDAAKISGAQRRIIDAYRRSLTRLRTGECRITEQYSSRGKETRKIYLAFDLDRDLIRSDTEFVGGKTYRLALTRNDQHLHIAGDDWVTHLDRADPIPLTQATPVDLRTIGRAGMGDYWHRTSLDKFTKAWAGSQITSVREDKSTDDLRWQITWTTDRRVPQAKGPMVFLRTWHVVTVDPKLDHCPVESKWYEIGDFKPLGADAETVERKLQQSATFEWEQKADIFVPKQVHFVGHPAEPLTIDVAFEWKSVNEPIDDQRFSVDDFDLPPGTRIGRDTAAGEDIIEREIPGRRGK